MFNSNIKNSDKPRLPTRNQQIYNHPFTIIAMLFDAYFWKAHDEGIIITQRSSETPALTSISTTPTSYSSGSYRFSDEDTDDDTQAVRRHSI